MKTILLSERDIRVFPNTRDALTYRMSELSRQKFEGGRANDQLAVVNLTPHTINVHTGEDVIEIPASGKVARVISADEVVGDLLGIPVVKTTYGEVEGIPRPKKHAIYIVSGMVLAQTSRKDVFAPGTLIRDAEGKPIGCDGLRGN